MVRRLETALVMGNDCCLGTQLSYSYARLGVSGRCGIAAPLQNPLDGTRNDRGGLYYWMSAVHVAKSALGLEW